MSEIPQPNFSEHAAIEQDIKDLTKELKDRGLSEQGKQALKTILQEKAPAPAIEHPMTTSPVSGTAPSASTSALPDYAKNEPIEVKIRIEKLLEMAWHKGIKQASQEAINAGPLVLDAFHDAVIDKLYPELKKRGLVK